MSGKPRIVKVPTTSLRPNEYNPNRQSEREFRLLMQSIAEDGFTLPIVVNDGAKDPRLKNMIVDGEHRWRAALALGLKEVPVTYVSLTEEEMKVATIRHNKARGHHDAALDAKLFQELMEMGMAPEEFEKRLGVDEKTLKAQLDLALKAAPSEVPDEVVAHLAEEEVASLGVEEDEAVRQVAERRARARVREALKEEDAAQAAESRMRYVRLTFRFLGEEYEVVRKVMDGFGGLPEAMEGLRDWWLSRSGA